LGIVNDPIKAIKNHALRFWATKDFAVRKLAFSRSTWFLHTMYCFCIIAIIDTFFILAVNDMFILIHFYERESFWLLNLVEESYYTIPPLLEVMILYFIFSPIIIKTTLKLSKAYSIKERRFFDWIEFHIKRRFPSYKTSSQRARERLDNPRKKGKLNKKYQKWLETKNDVERVLIRGGLWGVYLLFIGSVVFFMLTSTSDSFNALLGKNETVEEVIEEAELVIEEARPERPDGMPPDTIFNIFINKPNTVIP